MMSDLHTIFTDLVVMAFAQVILPICHGLFLAQILQ